MPQCLKCGADLPVNDEGTAPVLCDNCAGQARGRARRSMALGGLGSSPATMVLMAICIFVYVAMLLTSGSLGAIMGFSGQQSVLWGANYGPLTLSGDYWRLLTAGFLHANLIHLATNMWCLWSLGPISERLFGKWQTLAIFLLTGVGGALLSITYNPSRLEVGASGAVFGIVGALIAGLKFGNFAISEGHRKALLSSVISFAVINFVLGLGYIPGLGSIDNMCHLGGFISGLIVGLPLAAFARKSLALQVGVFLLTAAALSAAGRELVQMHGLPEQLKQAQAALDQNDYPRAIQFLEQYTSSHQDDDRILTVLGALYVETNQREKAITAFQKALKANPASETAKQALVRLGNESAQPK
ncbi:MAG TPA: rhomboid family intramembrane serine protease [Alphaproteobacteria bacterium]|nr:rhomboid family intramembrane serine protease [Alphaproteobacteria bacterium]